MVYHISNFAYTIHHSRHLLAIWPSIITRGPTVRPLFPLQHLPRNISNRSFTTILDLLAMCFGMGRSIFFVICIGLRPA